MFIAYYQIMDIERIHDLHYDRLLTSRLAVSSLRLLYHIVYFSYALGFDIVIRIGIASSIDYKEPPHKERIRMSGKIPSNPLLQPPNPLLPPHPPRIPLLPPHIVSKSINKIGLKPLSQLLSLPQDVDVKSLIIEPPINYLYFNICGTADIFTYVNVTKSPRLLYIVSNSIVIQYLVRIGRLLY
jgi:hypothetical protein